MTEDRSVPIFNNWEPVTINIPKSSNWTCYLFGGNASFSSITWTPEEGKVPNAWVRFWMKVFLDCNWVKGK
jgi:hypothetical protein